MFEVVKIAPNATPVSLGLWSSLPSARDWVHRYGMLDCHYTIYKPLGGGERKLVEEIK